MPASLPRRRRIAAGGAALAFLVTLLAAARAVPAQASERLVAAPHPIADALGRTWHTDRAAAQGGTVSCVHGPVPATASPALYRCRREGVRGYDLRVAPGRYAVDVLEANLRAERPGEHRFDVRVGGATTARGIDPAGAFGRHPVHTVFLATVGAGGRLALRFVSRGGTPVVSGLTVSRIGAGTGPLTTLWADEFSGRANSEVDPARWIYNVGTGVAGWGNHELQTYTERLANVRQDGAGHLVLSAQPGRWTDIDGQPRDYTSGRIDTGGTFSFTYGLVDVRAQLPAGRGIWPAIWALGDAVDRVGWPASGEIDIAELDGAHPRTVLGTVHGPSARHPAGGYAVGSARRAPRPLTGAWHRYSLLRAPEAIEFLLDGRTYGVRTPYDLGPRRPWVFDRPFHLFLDVAVGGTFVGPPGPDTPWPATMLVDYVRVRD